MHTVGYVLAIAGAVAIIAIGAAYLFKNAAFAARFGLPHLPAQEARGWWQVKGIRDVASGLLGLVFAVVAPAQLPLLLGVIAIIPLGDAIIVLANRGSKVAALAIHASTAAGLVLAALLLAL